MNLIKKKKRKYIIITVVCLNSREMILDTRHDRNYDTYYLSDTYKETSPTVSKILRLWTDNLEKAKKFDKREGAEEVIVDYLNDIQDVVDVVAVK